ncbi:MAG TPA: SEC-C metal-binding domain-containing protein, partial [Isosphaeraceae bacterium]|nr:SEC-C metal-binding domain-containing protein [Isosphaeraceae bacterium]
YPTRLEVPPHVWRDAVEKYDPEMRAEGRQVAEAGGLHIIGTERHESRRIDNQLRGRAGRQGDPGSSRFFLALEDDLMRKFMAEWVRNFLQRMGMQDGEAIESKMVSRRIEGAQKKVEERNFDARKNLLEYDEVMDEQRKRVYSFRQQLLEGAPTKDAILDMIDDNLKRAVDLYLADDYGPSSFAAQAGVLLGVELTPKDYKGATYEQAEQTAHADASAQMADLVREAVEENLPSDADPEEWNWLALASWANNRFGLNLKDRDFKKYLSGQGEEAQLDRSALETMLIEEGQKAVEKVDLSPAAEFLRPDWGRRSLAGWLHHKFGVAIDVENWDQLPKSEVLNRLRTEILGLYARKEAEFPVQVGLARFLHERGPQGGMPRYDRDGLARWASDRFHTVVDPAELQPMMRPEIETLLRGIAREKYHGDAAWTTLNQKLDAAYGPPPREGKPTPEPDSKGLSELASWARQELGVEVTTDELRTLGRTGARARLALALDVKHRPEMREMEKALLLQILDSSWMEHLRAMDHLRSSVGLRGYAQVDPKVEYKREGMKIFESMWGGVGDRVTDLVFRMEQVDPEFLNYLGARWQLDRAKTIHAAAPPTETQGEVAVGSNVRAQQEAAIAGSQKSEKKAEPLRNTGKKVGRNDPCPCGSGRK